MLPSGVTEGPIASQQPARKKRARAGMGNPLLPGFRLEGRGEPEPGDAPASSQSMFALKPT